MMPVTWILGACQGCSGPASELTLGCKLALMLFLCRDGLLGLLRLRLSCLACREEGLRGNGCTSEAALHDWLHGHTPPRGVCQLSSKRYGCFHCRAARAGPDAVRDSALAADKGIERKSIISVLRSKSDADSAPTVYSESGSEKLSRRSSCTFVDHSPGYHENTKTRHIDHTLQRSRHPDIFNTRYRCLIVSPILRG